MEERTKKIPFYLHIKDEPPFAFAGLHNVWQDTSGAMHPPYTIITTVTNDLVAHIYNRIPVFLKRDDEERWLSDSAPSLEDVQEILTPYPSSGMAIYPVSSRINSPTVANPGLIEPLEML